MGSNVILTSIKHGGKNFVVAIETGRAIGRLRVNSIRNMHYRNSLNIIEWLNDGLTDYVSDDFRNGWMQEIKNELQSKPQYNSADVRKKLVSAVKIVKDFESPKFSRENFRRPNEKQMQDERPEPPREEVKPAERSRKAYVERKTRNALATVRAMCCASADNWFCVNILFWHRSSVTN